MAANDRAIVVLHRFGEMHGGDVHERFPGDEGGTASENEGEGLALELSPGMGFFIQREGSYAVNDVFQMRRHGEIPDGCCNHDPMRLFDLLLERTEVIIGLAGLVVVLNREVLNVEISENGCFCGHTWYALAPFRKGRSKGGAITGIVRASADAEDACARCHAGEF